MGSASRRERHIPERLAEKLLHIRSALGLSQSEMLKRLGSPEKLQHRHAGAASSRSTVSLESTVGQVGLLGPSSPSLANDPADHG